MLQHLAPYAANEHNSRGRQFAEPSPNNRTEYQRDRDRIVHSAAFRRLEYKTQVFVNHEGDMFRTRLTHSIEVAQIARSIARILQLNEDLTEAVSLAHDLGHTPFGHAGQDVLNNCMQEYDGFEHNLQSLRIIDALEEKYAGFQGLNLTFETREGILKHCSKKNAERLGDVGERFLKNWQPTLEAQIANIADEIAYNNHDVDDGLRAGLITIDQLCNVALFREQYEIVKNLFPDLEVRRVIHEVIRRMINNQVTNVLERSQQQLLESEIKTLDDVRIFNGPLIAFSDTMNSQNLELKQFLRKNLYRHYRVHRMTVKAEKIIRALFNAFIEDNRLLPPEPYGKITVIKGTVNDNNVTDRARIVADYIAGMTDRYAIKEYERIFNPMQLT
ncbi:MAG: deoxyguanosinetriphosphate triphosphohydrolase [Gammaproteobacteria bacterium]|nr:deoxyguanosinetriphosphate triphosphohydrolase [Gammaproteobacteria bacterium]